jgi:hypothetical protein
MALQRNPAVNERKDLPSNALPANPLLTTKEENMEKK